MKRVATFVTAVVLAGVAVALADLGGAFTPPLTHPAIEYGRRPTTDAIAQLNRRLEQGAARLEFESAGRGYLRSILAALEIPVESQMVVFSKTGLQSRITNPKNPRAIYFNDSVVVAWVRGEPFVEIAAQDPRQGVNFYMLDQKEVEQPSVRKSGGCLTCHESLTSMGVPGMILKSTFVTPDGAARFHLGFAVPDHRTPIEERWGGWYVTGKAGKARHRGNAMVTDMEHPEAMITPETLNVASLKDKFDTDAYLSPYSDIVALLVFEHQMRMMNLITRVGWEVRVATHDKQSEKLPGLLRDAAREFVDYLLFVDEAPLNGRIEGSSGFAKVFAALGPRDRKGRSLRDLDLERRLMRYPCSYMIYSEAFDGMPPEAKDAIYQRMSQVLSGAEHDGKYARLSPADRQAVLEILRDTKKDWPSLNVHDRN
jgi:hypothetical protein